MKVPEQENCLMPDMEFVQKFTPPDFHSISPNFNSFSKKKHKKMPKIDTLDALDNAMTTILTTNLDNQS